MTRANKTKTEIRERERERILLVKIHSFLFLFGACFLLLFSFGFGVFLFFGLFLFLLFFLLRLRLGFGHNRGSNGGQCTGSTQNFSNISDCVEVLGQRSLLSNNIVNPFLLSQTSLTHLIAIFFTDMGIFLFFRVTELDKLSNCLCQLGNGIGNFDVLISTIDDRVGGFLQTFHTFTVHLFVGVHSFVIQPRLGVVQSRLQRRFNIIFSVFLQLVIELRSHIIHETFQFVSQGQGFLSNTIFMGHFGFLFDGEHDFFRTHTEGLRVNIGFSLSSSLLLFNFKFGSFFFSLLFTFLHGDIFFLTISGGRGVGRLRFALFTFGLLFFLFLFFLFLFLDFDGNFNLFVVGFVESRRLNREDTVKVHLDLNFNITIIIFGLGHVQSVLSDGLDGTGRQQGHILVLGHQFDRLFCFEFQDLNDGEGATSGENDA
mmetsp:Transcript_22589/g.25423  ORF Transcript_22589/g.25423 Transcript_22589/m.25423 type:complete len:429 (+) Transcript_22589:397-1683(+)